MTTGRRRLRAGPEAPSFVQAKSGVQAKSRAGSPPPPTPDAAVYVISVAAELTGLHPQTLRGYERVGLISPGRTGGGGRRYSHHDVELLREIAHLTSHGIGIEGVRRILELEHRVDALQRRNTELQAELDATREKLRRRPAAEPLPISKLPAVRGQQPGQSLVVWRRTGR